VNLSDIEESAGGGQKIASSIRERPGDFLVVGLDTIRRTWLADDADDDEWSQTATS